MSNRKILLTGAFVLACVAGGGGAFAIAEDDVQPAPVAETEAAEAAPVEEVPADQAAEVRQLERPQTSDDAMPSAYEDELTDEANADEHYGANPDLSRRTAPGVWVMPGDGHVCMANTTPQEGDLGLSCATPRDVKRGLLAPADIDANGNGIVTGVVPDGVTEVKVVDKNGDSRTVAVERNTYRAAIDADTKEVQFTDADGGEHVVPMAWKP
jgi:hypothetical protein